MLRFNRDRLFAEEDAEKLQFLSNGCGIPNIWGIHVGTWASCRPAQVRDGPGPSVTGLEGWGPGPHGDRPAQVRDGPGPAVTGLPRSGTARAPRWQACPGQGRPRPLGDRPGGAGSRPPR